MTIVGVIFGLIIGIALSVSNVSETTVKLIKFPGELLLRMLKALVLPLIFARSVIENFSKISIYVIEVLLWVLQLSGNQIKEKDCWLDGLFCIL